MAKPVPVNFANLYRPKQDMIWVALAGPAANIILAQFLLLLFRTTAFPPLLLGVYFNLGLAVFNLLPIPPLDGSRILAGLLPKGLDRGYLKLEPFGFLAVLFLYMTGLLYLWVIPGVNWFASFLGAPELKLS
jgi:Zn-dependent protease